MTDVGHTMNVVSDGVEGGQVSGILNWLESVDARLLTESKVRYSEPPLFSTQSAHSFCVSKKQDGWIDILKVEDRMVQVVLALRYNRQRWFPKQRKEWKKLISVAQQRFGEGSSMKVAGKHGEIFKTEDVSMVATSYHDKKSSYIHVKLALGDFSN